MGTIGAGIDATGTNIVCTASAMSGLRDGVAAIRRAGAIADYLPGRPRSMVAGHMSMKAAATITTKMKAGGYSYDVRSSKFTPGLISCGNSVADCRGQNKFSEQI